MKPSHFTTPRHLADCVFISSADPIERPATSSYYDAPFTVVVGLIVVAIMGVLILAGVIV